MIRVFNYTILVVSYKVVLVVAVVTSGRVRSQTPSFVQPLAHQGLRKLLESWGPFDFIRKNVLVSGNEQRDGASAVVMVNHVMNKCGYKPDKRMPNVAEAA